MSLRDIKELPSTMIGADLAQVASISETSHERFELFTTFSGAFVNAEAKNYFFFSHLFCLCQRISFFVFFCCKIAVLTQPIFRRSWSVSPTYCFDDKIPPPRSTVDWIKKSSPALEITPSACQQLSNALAWLALACINTRPVIHLCAIDHRLST